MERILVVAAHPDDETLGCGGALAKYLESGSVIRILVIGEGSTCRFSDPKSKEALDAIYLRRANTFAALSVLGVSDVNLFNAPCGRFDQFPLIEINKLIEKEIASFKPTIVFTHSEIDANRDHQITYQATIIATRPGVSDSIKLVASYEIPSSTEWAFSNVFSPNFFISLEEHQVATKWRALAQYGDEMRKYPFPRSEEGIQTLAKYRGMQTGMQFAEAFRIIRFKA